MNTKLIYFLLLSVFSFHCKTLPTPPASTPNTTFTIQQPSKFDCFKNHQYPGGVTQTTKISIHFVLTTSYFDGTRNVELEQKELTVDPNTTSFPITIVAKMPSDKLARVVVDVDGIDCSECANKYGDPAEPTGPCVNVAILNTNPQLWQAAKPKWQGGRDVQTYKSAIDLGSPGRIPNVSNTCNSGCYVQ